MHRNVCASGTKRPGGAAAPRHGVGFHSQPPPRKGIVANADPPDVPKRADRPQGGREWLQSILSRFGPVREKASNTTVLDFEKPLVELDNRIKEVGTAGITVGEGMGIG